jgi:DNA-binding response OmpR family regulator
MKRKNNLLIVEDDVLNQKVYKAILSKDYEIKICGDDEKFYAALKENEYDLFIIDLSLNCEKNGLDLIRELREIEKYKDTPIIVVTGFVSIKDKEIAIAAGATKFINKPFNMKTLLAEIKKYFI